MADSEQAPLRARIAELEAERDTYKQLAADWSNCRISELEAELQNVTAEASGLAHGCNMLEDQLSQARRAIEECAKEQDYLRRKLYLAEDYIRAQDLLEDACEDERGSAIDRCVCARQAWESGPIRLPQPASSGVPRPCDFCPQPAEHSWFLPMTPNRGVACSACVEARGLQVGVEPASSGEESTWTAEEVVVLHAKETGRCPVCHDDGRAQGCADCGRMAL